MLGLFYGLIKCSKQIVPISLGNETRTFSAGLTYLLKSVHTDPHLKCGSGLLVVC